MLKFQSYVFGTSIGYVNHMEESRHYIIHFTYQIREDAIEFQLQADVTVKTNNTYFVNNIRLAGKNSDSLIPPISLTKHKGSWIYSDSKKETALSLAIGHAIDNHDEGTPGVKTSS